MLKKEADEFFKPKKTRTRKIVEEKKLVEVEIEKSNNLVKKAISLLALLILLGLVGTSVYFYRQYKKAVASPVAAAQDEIKTITDQIGKFMELPTDAPTLATVSDKEKLQGQAFFANAQNGDKVLIYSKSQKAILWRPATSKVIEVASLAANTQNQQPAQQQAVQPQANSQDQVASTQNDATNVSAQKIKVVVYNGTKTKGLAGKLADQISNAIPETEITETGNATGDYPKTTIVDLSGNNSELVQKIITTIGGEIGSLPANEKKPAGDILVIGGGE